MRRSTKVDSANVSLVYQRGADDSVEPLHREIPQDPELEMSGRGLYSTVGDYVKFMRMILNGGAINADWLFERATIEMMSQHQMGANRVCVS